MTKKNSLIGLAQKLLKKPQDENLLRIFCDALSEADAGAIREVMFLIFGSLLEARKKPAPTQAAITLQNYDEIMRRIQEIQRPQQIPWDYNYGKWKYNYGKWENLNNVEVFL